MNRSRAETISLGRSQLRQLALRYANGDLEAGTYCDVRTCLIDDITSGRRAIERHEMSGVARFEAADKAPIPTRSNSRFWSYVISALVMLTALCLATSPLLDKPSAATAASIEPSGKPVDGASEPPGRTGEKLLKELLARSRWTPTDLNAFRSQWQALPASSTEQARRSEAFAKVLRALSEQTAMRPGPALAKQGKAQRGKHHARAAAMLESALTAAGPVMHPTDQLAAQPPDNYTVQVLTARRKSQALELAQAFPELGLRIQRSVSTPHLYRVVHGNFGSQELAEQTAEALPQMLLGIAEPPLVRRISSLKGQFIVTDPLKKTRP